MTAEVVLFNPFGVAMAADSTLTAGNRKLYHSANKIFALAPHHPVGIMYYQRAMFMDVPWETLIKVFRRTLPRRGLGTVDEYKNAFLEFLRTFGPTSLPESRNVYALLVLHRTWESLKVRMEDEACKCTTRRDERRAVVSVLEQEVKRLVLQHGAITKRSVERRRTEEEHGTLIYKFTEDSLKPYYDAPTKAALDLSMLIAAHHLTRPSTDANGELLGSGLVLAGFGEDEVYPEIRSIEVEGLPFEDSLVFREMPGRGGRRGVGVVPFAQSDVAETFVFGIAQDMQRLVGSLIADAALGSVRAVMQTFRELATAGQAAGTAPRNDDGVWDQLATLAEMRARDAAALSTKTLTAYIEERRRKPLEQVLYNLQKDELGEAAEALLNLTKLKRRLSESQETVGGPIDVAVITKGDGFIWTKRKHYFPPAMNPQFFTSRLGSLLAADQARNTLGPDGLD